MTNPFIGRRGAPLTVDAFSGSVLLVDETQVGDARAKRIEGMLTTLLDERS